MVAFCLLLRSHAVVVVAFGVDCDYSKTRHHHLGNLLMGDTLATLTWQMELVYDSPLDCDDLAIGFWEICEIKCRKLVFMSIYLGLI